jgi:type VI secretion system protein ImpH
MGASGREHDSGLGPVLHNLLGEEPYTVRFFQAVRLLRRALPHRRHVGEFAPPSAEAVRFRAHPSLAFPASEIQSVEWPENPEAPVRMEVNFMGLCSPVGVMPGPYTEFIIRRAQKRDNGFRDFLDLFNHRIISLFYRAWERYHFFAGYERRELDPLTPLLMSLIGLNTKALRERQRLEDESLAFYAGLLAPHPRSAQALRQVLEDYFQVPVEVQQFVGRWIRLPRQNQTCFDDAQTTSTQLGLGVVVGDEVLDHQSTTRIRLGPLTREQYMDFLPSPEARAYPALQAWLKFYAREQIDFEVQLVLKREDVPESELRSEGEGHLMLGWMSWIKNVPISRDPGETVLEM